MQIHVIEAVESIGRAEACVLIVPVWDGVELQSVRMDAAQRQTLQALRNQQVFRAKAGECYYLPSQGTPYQGLLALGLGVPEKCTAETLRRAAGKACALLSANRIGHVLFEAGDGLHAEAFVEGLMLGQYVFDPYKSQDADEPVPVTVERITLAATPGVGLEALQERCARTAIIATGANAARHLANTPSNDMTPEALAEFAMGLTENAPCICTVLDTLQMATLGMNALLGVARGGAMPPKLIVLEYRPRADAKTLALVGKGITFDSGGISLKPGDGMHEMKYDMCGAAAVLCAFMNILELRPDINVVAVVPAATNMPGAEAQTPGDIVRAYNGKTIEIHNTDAEGRLILADALAYTVEKFRPDALVDLATLTGACVVALGHYAAGLMGNDHALNEALQYAADATGERVWPLPLWDDYRKLVEGEHADLCNIGPKGEAGAIVGGMFLKEFVGDTPWAHLDIAGTAWGGKHIPYWDPKYATGYGVRLLTEWILQEARPR